MTRRVPLKTGGEARYHDDDPGKDMQLDEVCTKGAVHLERMDHGCVSLIISDGSKDVYVTLYTDAPHRLRMFVMEGEC